MNKINPRNNAIKTNSTGEEARANRNGFVKAGLGIVALAATSVALFPQQSQPSGAEGSKPQHSTAYLDTDAKQKNIEVGFNDTPEDIALVVNGGRERLRGQALLDATDYIRRQGSIIEPNGLHELHTGDVVEAPIVTDQQIIDGGGQ